MMTLRLPISGGVRAHLVAERRLGDDVEAEVVAEVLAGVADDLEAQTEAVALGLAVAQRRPAPVAPRGDGDDLTDLGRVRPAAASGLTATTLSAIRSPVARARMRSRYPPPLHTMRCPVM